MSSNKFENDKTKQENTDNKYDFLKKPDIVMPIEDKEFWNRTERKTQLSNELDSIKNGVVNLPKEIIDEIAKAHDAFSYDEDEPVADDVAEFISECLPENIMGELATLFSNSLEENQNESKKNDDIIPANLLEEIKDVFDNMLTEETYVLYDSPIEIEDPPVDHNKSIYSKTCRACGREFETNAKNKLFCHFCTVNRKPELDKRAYRVKKEKVRQRLYELTYLRISDTERYDKIIIKENNMTPEEFSIWKEQYIEKYQRKLLELDSKGD